MKTNAVVLGAGMVGSVIAEDLSSSGFSVTIADINGGALARVSERSNQTISIAEIDCSDQEAIAALAADADIVFGALPSWLGFAALETVIKSGKPYCDISFMEEDPRTLHELAKKHGVTCVVDFGVAPGMSHLLCSVANETLDVCKRLDIVVGGLPLERTWPWEYKASFSPRDVVEEYIRPARLVEHGEMVTREALSECVLLDLPGVGTLEAFNSDGLRTLCDTLDVPFMKERTLRYPGHAKQMKMLRDGGFFKTEEIEVAGQKVKPIDMTAKILIDGWKYEEGEADLIVMRVEGEGTLGDTEMLIRWDLLDYYDNEKGQSSMARTTGFPAASIGRMIVDGTINMPGVLPPETFGENEVVVRRLLLELEDRGVRYIRTMEPVS
ncbi:MAG: saccharopine dehydrogenase [Phycisphaerae bacterium]|jgi:lysine 6-dehydrogenase|nr:saccharopine dehydrogenase [Phycisphaerae bacterium]HJN72222.1 saccharopine dehydrogenase C-terminal domain-containing protein [Phycisphaerales bacterium]|tara:strand:+ start:2254 stop:3402 length:1149 start_codon:yes stop_codon:yes gene_type:complete